MEIRTLRADEIECRVQIVRENGCSILLYKDARCDMKILDELFGITGWQRSHEVINGNLFCNISIWDKEKKQWITKQDVGTESYTEKEKGQASDSFKRAAFNIGIGRELYTAPFIWINLEQKDINKNGNKVSIKTKFRVSKIDYNDNKEITSLEIKDNHNKTRYTYGAKNKANEVKVNRIDANKVVALKNLAGVKNSKVEDIEKYYGMKVEDMDLATWTKAINVLKSK